MVELLDEDRYIGWVSGDRWEAGTPLLNLSWASSYSCLLAALYGIISLQATHNQLLFHCFPGTTREGGRYPFLGIYSVVIHGLCRGSRAAW
jgi:hypothetical protein